MSEYKITDVHAILLSCNSNLTKILLLHNYPIPLRTINHDDYYENNFVMNKLSPDNKIDVSNEETSGEESSGSEIKNSNVLVSKSTRIPEDNVDLQAIHNKVRGRR